jgi:hypothetical protein
MEEVRDIVLECPIRKVRKLKKPMDDRNAGASDGCQEEGKKRTLGETLRRVLWLSKGKKSL